MAVGGAVPAGGGGGDDLVDADPLLQQGGPHHLGPRVHAHFLVDVRQVELDGRLGDRQAPRLCGRWGGRASPTRRCPARLSLTGTRGHWPAGRWRGPRWSRSSPPARSTPRLVFSSPYVGPREIGRNQDLATPRQRPKARERGEGLGRGCPMGACPTRRSWGPVPVSAWPPTLVSTGPAPARASRRRWRGPARPLGAGSWTLRPPPARRGGARWS